MSSSRWLLAVDTSAAVSAAVHDGTAVLAARQVFDPRRHAELLMPLVDEVLRVGGADRRAVTAVAVGTGPGPFTGLRVGLVTARALALALGVPVHGVPSLDALALQVLRQRLVAPGDEFVVATDARRREVYWGRYRAPIISAEEPVLLSGPAVDRPGEVALSGAPCFGRGALLYAELLDPSGAAQQGTDPTLDASAAAVAELAVRRIADGVATPGEPLYLRRPDAVEPAARKRALT